MVLLALLTFSLFLHFICLFILAKGLCVVCYVMVIVVYCFMVIYNDMPKYHGNSFVGENSESFVALGNIQRFPNIDIFSI